MENAINVLVSKSLTWLENTGEIINAELPIFIDQLLRYQFVIRLFYSSIGLIFCFLGIVFILKGVKFRHLSDNCKTDIQGKMFAFCVIYYCLGIILSSVGPIVFFSNINGFIEVMIAPRIYLIEYLRHFI